jgi:hypothetical protein
MTSKKNSAEAFKAAIYGAYAVCARYCYHAPGGAADFFDSCERASRDTEREHRRFMGGRPGPYQLSAETSARYFVVSWVALQTITSWRDAARTRDDAQYGFAAREALIEAGMFAAMLEELAAFRAVLDAFEYSTHAAPK